MKLPQLIDYQQAIQARSFADPALRYGTPELTPLRQPLVASGGFALTFTVNSGGQRFAVRCFHKQGARLRERYAAVAEFVQAHRVDMGFLTDVAFVAEGIRVNSGVFPIVRMPWVEGKRLDSWVEDHLHEPRRLDQVRSQVTAAAARLRAAGAAHGDLQHGNILVDGTDRIRLVDYDGMYVPALADFGASEFGHRNYQHPDRANSYGSHLDAFSACVIDLSLEALKYDPALWHDFNTGENLILEAEDFAAPARSEVFARLARIGAVAERARVLIAACQADFAAVPAILAGERVSGTGRQSTSTAKRPAGPRAVDAHNRSALMARVGDHVTIVGQVTDTRAVDGRQTRTAFINFGNWRNGAFRIVAWGGITRELEATFNQEVTALRGSWVALSGMVTQYWAQGATRPSPQIELKRVQTLRILTEAAANAMLAPPPATPPPPAPPPPAAPLPDSPPLPTTAPRGSLPRATRAHTDADDLARSLDRLYSSRRATRTPATPPTPVHQPLPVHPPPPTHHRPPVPRLSWWQRVRARWRR
ncbi:hypothetical protein L6E12_20330 [Actinokineospora sp. PR83]|uniref:hypothetical protein n=1 Tax=Actinokineospora sp. PR83 TaxID=2884908 RepID=UPI001F19CAE4|nr:hypothetical protein [Actinokineospora sp. PR83]MCG8918133.1 hypothetical protein [Actinokineospora sp. PR83]